MKRKIAISTIIMFLTQFVFSQNLNTKTNLCSQSSAIDIFMLTNKEGISIKYVKEHIDQRSFVFYYQDLPYTGIAKGCVENNLKAITNFVDGKIEGECIEYYLNGNISKKFLIKNGEKEGEFIKYHENGNISKKSNFLNGKLNGEKIEYYEDGIKLNKSNYVSGKIEGESISYYENGNIRSKYNHINGDLEGEYLFYSDDGVLLEKGNYVKNEEEGKWEQFDTDGNKMAIRMYEKGVEISCKGSCNIKYFNR